MKISLGNLSIAEFEKRTGFVFSDEDRKWLESHRTDNANLKFDSGKFHIFDIPLTVSMSETIKDKLLTILEKYNKIYSIKEPCTIAVITETEKEKQLKEKKEKEHTEQDVIDNNPNAIWNVKWHMLVPVKVKFNGELRDLYYCCFINTFTTGKSNIPDTINGYAYMSLDEHGLSGTFTLTEPEKDNDAGELFNCNHIIGGYYYSAQGHYIGYIQNVYFEEVRFDIKEAINLYDNIHGYSGKEIHFRQ